MQKRAAHLLLWLAVSGAAGYALHLSFADAGIWLLAPFALALLHLPLWRLRLRGALCFGLLAAAVFWMLHLHWLTAYLGPIPWLSLSALMTLFFTVYFALAWIGVRACAGLFNKPWPAALLSAIFIGALWSTRETIESAIPYGGFAWGRIMASQANGPLLQAVSVFGIAGAGALLVALSVLPIPMFYTLTDRRVGRSLRLAHARPLLAAILLSCVVWAMLALVANPTPYSKQSVKVLGVQGNASAGIFQDRENGSVLADHIRATEAYLDSHPDPQLDLVIWPENAAEFGVDERPIVRAQIANLARSAGAPVLVGTVLRETASQQTVYRNSAVLVDSKASIQARYDKMHPVPFGEYMPDREFYEKLAPELVNLIQLEYQPGTRKPLINSNGVRYGVAICFDAVFDVHTRAMLEADADVFIAMTNNADFGVGAQAQQQLALMRLQAVAAGRPLLGISTVGESAAYTADGTQIEQLGAHTSGAIAAELAPTRHTTIATAIGGWVSGGLFFLSALVLLAGCVRRVMTLGRGGHEGV